MNWKRGAALALALFACRPLVAAGVEVDEIIWGYNGKPVAARFNPLSVLVRNPSAAPFDGSLRLTCQMPGGSQVGETFVEPVYLSPNSSRWLQFTPFVQDQYVNWELRSSDGNKYTVPSVQAGEPAIVLLTDPTVLAQRSAAVRRFPDELFPATVTGTDGLVAVLIDHVPRWDEMPRQAFLDWLAKGGTAHILRDTSDREVEFPPALSILNSKLERTRVGAGTVVRHSLRAEQLTADYVKNAIAVPRFSRLAENKAANPVSDAIDRLLEEKAKRQQEMASNAGVYGDGIYGDVYISNLDDRLLRDLKSLTRVDHMWPLIYLLALVYIVLVFPGLYLVGRRRADYRIVYGLLLAVVAVFSVAFSVIGRRGYGESTRVDSAMIAYQLSGDYYDVTGWTNVFVTAGSDYLITHDGGGRAYSTCQQVEAVNGYVTTGAGGVFAVDIPPFSSRSFAHRVRCQADPMILKAEELATDGDRLRKIVVTVADGLSQQGKDIVAWAMYRDQLYPMRLEKGKLEMKSAGALDITSALATSEFAQNQWIMPRGIGGRKQDESNDVIFRKFQIALIARSLDLNSRQAISDFVLPRGVVRVFVYARLPEALAARLATSRNPSLQLSQPSGWVLYVADVEAPEAEP